MYIGSGDAKASLIATRINNKRLCPSFAPRPSLIATNAFVLFVAGFVCGRFDVGGSKCSDLHISLSFLICL